ncbi:MAG: pyridoxal phosphate-dependent aminotransferase [Pseudomonadota bacterium]
MSRIEAPEIRLQPVSVTRKMAASLPGLRRLAQEKGLKIHHLGAGYPHPEVTDPRRFLVHQDAYFRELERREGANDPETLPEHLRESFSYSDTLGPASTRAAFARVYGADWGVSLDPDKLVPTVGATGGISLICSLFERPGTPVAYITDAPTYAGFLARANLCAHARIFSVELDDEGPVVERLRAQIRAAREAGYHVPFYYTVPDGHNPAGFSFSQARREAVVAVAREEGVLIVEDAPYIYINYAEPWERPSPFLSLAPEQTVHLFTGSKIGFPGPRVAFLYSDAILTISGGEQVPLRDLALTEASAEILFQNPGALLGFEALLHDDDLVERRSLWPVAEEKLAVYRENREIMLEGLERELGAYREHFHWTEPGAGFFTVFTFKSPEIRTDEAFVERLVSEHGVVVIPMYDFYPRDARERDPRAGLDQLRLSFCFTESTGEQRRQDLRESVAAFAAAARQMVGVG